MLILHIENSINFLISTVINVPMLFRLTTSTSFLNGKTVATLLIFRKSFTFPSSLKTKAADYLIFQGVYQSYVRTVPRTKGNLPLVPWGNSAIKLFYEFDINCDLLDINDQRELMEAHFLEFNYLARYEIRRAFKENSTWDAGMIFAELHKKHEIMYAEWLQERKDWIFCEFNSLDNQFSSWEEIFLNWLSHSQKKRRELFDNAFFFFRDNPGTPVEILMELV